MKDLKNNKPQNDPPLETYEKVMIAFLGLCILPIIIAVFYTWHAKSNGKEIERGFVIPKPEYHIKLEPFIDCYYYIKFTEDNWLTYEFLHQVSYYPEIDYSAEDQRIFSKDEALKIAYKLKTYTQAVKFNDSVHREIKAINIKLKKQAKNKPKPKSVPKECEKPETILIR